VLIPLVIAIIAIIGKQRSTIIFIATKRIIYCNIYCECAIILQFFIGRVCSLTLAWKIHRIE
jgi:hypothetical protein